MIYVIGPNDKGFDLKGKTLINVTSQSKDYGRELSPFLLGPCKLYEGLVSENMENAWQYSKVYPCHDNNGKPSNDYFKWAIAGWKNKEAVRYPMGKGTIPAYSFWHGKKLNYIEARLQIYIPLYAKAARECFSFDRLKCDSQYEDIVLFDFDGYHTDKKLKDIVADPEKKCGHAFVLKMMLIDLI